MAIDANGVITWTPQQNQSPSTNLVTTVVTNTNPYDLVNPHLAATNSFLVVVREVNTAPVLATVPTQYVNELTLLTVTNTASEANIHSTLGYLLVGAPSGMAIDANGVITWTPQQNQSPSTNLVTTAVTNSNPYDLVNPHLAATNSFLVVVREVNTAPVLAVIGTRTITAMTSLVVTNRATDSNIHAALSYALINPPTGMSNSSDGVVFWTPTLAQAPSTNLITTVAISHDPYDAINPQLSTTNYFIIRVVLPPTVTISLSKNQVRLSWSSVSGTLYQVQYRNAFDGTPWLDLGGPVGATGDLTEYLDPWSVATPQRFYRIVLAGTPAVPPPSLTIVMAGEQPQLTWSSLAGTRYQVQYRTAFDGASWTNLGGPITAIGTTTLYLDTAVTSDARRFYRIQVEN